MDADTFREMLESSEFKRGPAEGVPSVLSGVHTHTRRLGFRLDSMEISLQRDSGTALLRRHELFSLGTA